MQKTAEGWSAWRGILGRNKRGEESDTGRYKIGDGLSSWRALNYAGESSGGSATPSMFQQNSGTVLDTTITYIEMSESDEYPIADENFELVDGKIVVLNAGRYKIEAFFNGALSGGTAIDVPGLVALIATVSVNEQGAGPAWNFYPRTEFSAIQTNQSVSMSWSFPQDLAVDDEIQFGAWYELLGSTDLGDVDVSSGFGFLTLTKA